MTYSIELNGVGKRYAQLQEQAMLLKSVLPGRTARKREFWAVRDVSFGIEPGETVAILGRNGAGKTTLLRLIAGVSCPSEGRVRVQGRVAPLISVGVGFHQEMSGRENVYVNGMLLGLSHREVARRFDEIVAFAELEDILDTPVKFYSSGEFVRLGFAVAIHVDPEILLVDEVLAVGDLGFQLKCFDRIRKLQTAGTTIVLVSHNLHSIRLLCPRVLLFTGGHLVMDDSAEAAIGRYHELLSADSVKVDDGHDPVNGPVTVLSRSVQGPQGPTHHAKRGDQLWYRITLRFNQDIDNPFIAFHVTSQEGIGCYIRMAKPGQAWRCFKRGDTLDVEVAFCALLAGGTYQLSIGIRDRNARTLLAANVGEVVIYVAPVPGSMGLADLDAKICASGLELSKYDDLTLRSNAPAAESLNWGRADHHQLEDQSARNEDPDGLVASEA